MKLITARAASDMLNIRLHRLYELTRQSAVPHVRIGRRQLRYDEGALIEWATCGGNVAGSVGKRLLRARQGEVSGDEPN